MEEKVVAGSIIKVVGVSSVVLGVIFLGLLARRNYFEVVKLKLEIESLNKQLGK